MAIEVINKFTIGYQSTQKALKKFWYKKIGSQFNMGRAEIAKINLQVSLSQGVTDAFYFLSKFLDSLNFQNVT